MRVPGSCSASSARCEQRVGRRVPGADDGGVPAGEGRARSRPSTSGSAWLTRSATSARPSGSSPLEARLFGRSVGARRVDDGAGGELFETVGGARSEQERGLCAAGGAGAVHALAGDRLDRDAGADARGDGLELRRAVRGTARRARCRSGARSGRGELPSGRLEQALRGRVDEVLPRGEQPDVAPLPHARADRVAGLVDHEVDAALDEVGGGGQADRAGADDRDGQGVEARCRSARDGEVDQGHAGAPPVHRCSSILSVATISMIVNIR